jgi:cell division septation protein DedD
VRTAFIVLVLANLGFMAWAVWIDMPPQVQTSNSTSRLPRLKLVTEAAPPRAQSGGQVASANNVSNTSPPADAAIASTAVGQAAPAGATYAAGGPGVTSAQPIAQVQRCVSVGPFSDVAEAARTASALHSRGFAPQQRTAEGDVAQGFWVYIGGVDNVDKADRILRALDKGGFKDARLMPDDGEGHRISVGLFSERERAEHRATAVQKLGLKTQVGERTEKGTVYWVDLAVKQSDGEVPVQDLLADAGATDSRVSVQACPTVAGGRRNAGPAEVPTDSGPAGSRLPSNTVAGTPQLKDAH